MAKDVPQPHGGSIRLKEKGDPGGPGRPKKLVTTVLEDLKKQGYSRVGPDQVRETLETLVNLPKEELLEMANGDGGHPMLVVIAARGLCSKKGWEVLSDLLDRTHGKAKQQLDLQGNLAVAPVTLSVVVQPPSDAASGK